ncbi:MAG: class I SAM-dependent methyltransferase [bacterium]|nr:class I SAM-dependent methyltransferase [bacterium]
MTIKKINNTGTPPVLGQGKLKRHLFKKIKTRPRLHLRYLRLAKFLSNHGITPPFTVPASQHETRWRHQGTGEIKAKPEKYARHDDSVEKLFQDILPYLTSQSNILEIGCNAGRSLEYLFRKGFTKLTGIEIGVKALETFQQVFPETYNSTRVMAGNAVDEIRKLETDAYDLVFTHSVLVNIGAGHNAFFAEMCRVCRGYILIMESEGTSSAFPRDFEKMFAKHGYAMVAYKWLVWNEEKKLVFPNPVAVTDVLKNNRIRIFAPNASGDPAGGQTFIKV